MSTTDQRFEIPAQERQLWPGLDRRLRLKPFATTRSVMIIIGFFALWLAHLTRVTYTVQEMRLRDLCVVALYGTAIVGLAHVFIKPNGITRGVIGLLIMFNALVRMVGFGLPVWEKINHNDLIFVQVWHLAENSGVLPVWGLLGYMAGFVIFVRRNDRAVGAEGARDDP